MAEFDLVGIGMTSQRTRDRLVERLREQGIVDTRVLAQMRNSARPKKTNRIIRSPSATF